MMRARLYYIYIIANYVVIERLTLNISRAGKTKYEYNFAFAFISLLTYLTWILDDLKNLYII